MSGAAGAAPAGGQPSGGTSGVPFLVPPGLDAPTGGNRYDQRLLADLPGLRAVTVTGPDPAAALDEALGAVPAGSPVLLDGLVATARPDVLAAHAHRLRAVLLVHLLRADDDPPAAPLEDERRSLAAATVVVATSAWSARRLRDLGVAADRLVLAPPGTAPARPSAALGAHRLLSVGTVCGRKGQALAVEAVQRLGAPWTLGLAGGPGPGGGAVEAAVRAAGTGARTALLGPLDAAALAARWDRTDLHVLLSSREPYGMAVAEALARGVPSLVSAAGELPDLVGDAGLVVERSADAVAAALQRWAGDAALRRDLRAAARRRAGRLPTWEGTAAAVRGALELARDAPRPGGAAGG
ncbi:glycosyltransferase [Kineococcus sp. SYSU DK004]|uniref:glycosyltransferase n=1 Tax=Kineococcus sp. SYSU DK004 TaxID=3383125 RepID=UPI003D7DEC34